MSKTIKTLLVYDGLASLINCVVIPMSAVTISSNHIECQSLHRPVNLNAGEFNIKKVRAPLPRSCWQKTLKKHVFVKGLKYFTFFRSNGTIYKTSRVQYQIVVPLAGNSISVQLRCKLISSTEGVRALRSNRKVMGRIVRRFSTATNWWSRQFVLKASDPDCGEREYRISYHIIWVDTIPDAKVFVHDEDIRAELRGRELHMWQFDNANVCAHEFAHCLGLPDEYSADGSTEIVRYYKPDGSFDRPIMALSEFGDEKKGSDATLLSSHIWRSAPRHAWNIAIEVQAMLTAVLNRKISCEIRYLGEDPK
jgi:type VI secretion system secreted protein VgrG